ncbi:Potassium transporter [Neofusicoccum parvum]|nr:Potassium transporter [Neofusicoccum parvum]
MPLLSLPANTAQVFSGWALLLLAYQSTGVIYGDIGTSPLYVYSSTFSSEPSHDDLLGALSLIIWAVTLIVTVKYVLIVLSADDEGEGGTFAIYSLLARYCNISKQDPKKMSSYKLERWQTHELRTGLKVVREDIGTDTIVGVSCAILVLLFALQPLGISKLASGFAPVVIVWLLLNFCFGVYNLATYDASVLKAFSPYFAGQFFVRNKTDGWISLGGILLAFTGVEALFADLGAFSQRAIQLSWLCLAYPCLLVAYIGQAAYISENEGAFANPFFESVPPGMFYPSLVISILAAIVASQALITSAFQLLAQVMNTSYFPQIKMIYTSEKFHGQVYIPFANWLMMIGTIIVTAVYNNTTKLGHAYGFCVVLVTFITTNLVALVALVVWRAQWWIVLPIWFIFATLDGLFLSSAATKFIDGAWFTFVLALILASFFILWRYGKEQQWSSEHKHRSGPLLVKGANGQLKLSDHFGGGEIHNFKGLGIFFDKAGTKTPAVYAEFVRKFQAQQDVHVFLHLRALQVPHVGEADRFEVSGTAQPNCYRMIIRHGYNDHPVNADLGTAVYEQLRAAIVAAPRLGADPSAASEPASAGAEDFDAIDIACTPPKSPVADDDAGDGGWRLAALDAAFATQVVYVVGKEQLRLLRESNGVAKRVVLAVFLWFRDNTRAKVAKMNIPVDKLVEVGFFTSLATMALSMNCSTAALPPPSVFGAEIVSVEASLVQNYSATVKGEYFFGHPTIQANNLAFCNVTVTHTHPGWDDTLLTNIWLPADSWNGRMQAIGGGGMVAGMFPLSYIGMAGAVADGYASISLNGGLPDEDATKWALTSPGNVNLYLLEDFAARSLADGTLIAKSIIDSFYGRPAEYSYWSGCSQGGRQGFMLAQRYPTLYDGIHASAPAINWNEFLMGDLWPQQVLSELGSYPHACELDALTAAAIAACDGLDGVVDGLISDVDNCHFSPYPLVGTPVPCASVNHTVRISAAAAAAADAVWTGTDNTAPWYTPGHAANMTSTNSLAATTCTANGTCTGSPLRLFTDWLTHFVAASPSFPTTNLSRSAYLALYHAATTSPHLSALSTSSPSLATFRAAGGKLLTYHGTADPIIPLGNTRHHHARAAAANPRLRDFFRYFEAPGVAHCSGGAGPQPEGAFAALVAWVERGEAPEVLVGTMASGGERVLCLYPRRAVWDGVGEVGEVGSWRCEGEEGEEESEL